MKTLLILLLSASSILNAQSLDPLIKQYNQRVVFYSISLLQKPNLFARELSTIVYDSTTGLYSTPSESGMVQFFRNANTRLREQGDKAAKEIVRKIETISRVNVLISTINNLYNSDKEDPTTEALYLTSSTRHLFKKYIVLPGSQDWNSLSSFEANSLYRDFILYLLSQPDKKQKLILTALIETLTKKALT